MQLRGVVLLLLILTGCATARPEAATSGPAALSIGVPFYPQEDYQCGPAALAMTLGWSGHHIEPADLVREVFTAGRNGSLQPDLVAATRRHDRIAYVIGGRDELLAELAAGNPVIVLQNLGLSWFPRWHYAVAVGHDAARGSFLLHSGRDAHRVVGEETFLRTWERAGAWGLLTLPPARLPITTNESRWLAAVVGVEQAGRTEAAAAAYSAAVERWPESVGARIGLANAQYAAGNLDDAEQSLRTAIVAHPNAAVAWNNLAHVLGERGRKTAAVAAARRAVEIGGPDRELYEQTLTELQSR